MSQDARLVLRDNPSKAMSLPRSKPTTIGKAESNLLRLATLAGVSDHHAVVRFSLSQGWLVCDWQSSDGTFLEGQRIRQCRRLSDGDEIQLGANGPVLVFRLVPIAGAAAPVSPPSATGSSAPASGPGSRGAAGSGAASSAAAAWGTSPSAAAPPGAASPRQQSSGSDSAAAAAARNRASEAATAATGGPGGRGTPRPAGASAAGSSLTIAGRSIPLDQIRSAQVRSRQLYPNSFSWWVLICLGSTVLLPFQWLFWGVEIAALAAWILLGSRKQHQLVITLRDGMAFRHDFNNRITALSHRNGIRKAIGQSLESG